MSVRRDKKYVQLQRALAKRIAEQLVASAIIIQNEIKISLSSHGRQPSRGSASSPPGSPPGVRTGTLRRSWQVGLPGNVYDVSQTKRAVKPKIRIGSNVVYARIHEFGGIIRAKKAKALTIPLNREAEQLLDRYGSARAIPGLKVIRTKKKTAVLARVKERLTTIQFGSQKPKITPLFALVKFVRMPPRPYVRPALARARPQIRKLFEPDRLLAGIKL